MHRARSDRHTVLTSGPFWAVPYASPAPATVPILERPPRQTACVVTSPKAQMVVIPVSSLAIGRGGQVPRTLTLKTNPNPNPNPDPNTNPNPDPNLGQPTVTTNGM